MRECVKHRMTMGQLARFTSANGLYLNGSRIYALDGKNVGRVRLASSRAFRPESFGLDKPRASGQGRSARVVRGAPLILSVIQGLYNLSAQADHDGCQITAWRPAWRPARTLITGDGEMEAGDLLGPEEVICDLCNTDVSIRPVPMGGSYALCTACLARQGMPFPGTISPYCLLPARDGEGVRW
jgi:hypothetical protein